MKFNEKLRKLIKSQRYTQEPIAKAAGVSQNLVSLWVRGINEPGMREALALARFFGVDVEYLADDAREEPIRRAELPADEFLVLENYRALRDNPVQRMDAREAIRRLSMPIETRTDDPGPGQIRPVTGTPNNHSKLG